MQLFYWTGLIVWALAGVVAIYAMLSVIGISIYWYTQVYKQER